MLMFQLHTLLADFSFVGIVEPLSSSSPSLPFFLDWRVREVQFGYLITMLALFWERQCWLKTWILFFLLFGTVCIPTSKSIWMKLQSQMKCYQKHGSFKAVVLCGRLFNLSPAVCDIITLIYVWVAFWDFIYQRDCVFWNLILMKYLTSWMG